MNRVRLYSNGTGVFDRVFPFASAEPLQISLPIPSDSLDEAIASIGVFGDVTLVEPPSYAPLGTDATDLKIDPKAVIRDLAMKLRGAQVVIQTPGEMLRGRLAGLQEYREQSAERLFVDRYRLAIFEENGALRTVQDREITTLQFADASVQAEIDKALQSAFETIKPNSAFINLTVRPNGETVREAQVQYAVAQMGAWKLSYRLRGLGEKWEIEGQAIVDNNTDEPWEQVQIAVMTGQPISFATDLAEIRPVQRRRVNMVRDTALESFVMEDEIPGVVAGMVGSASMSYDEIESMDESPRRNVKRSSLAASYNSYESYTPYAQRAQQEQAKAQEFGAAVEYSFPTPVTVGANRSAIIPMFAETLDDARLILVYRQKQHPTHPFRAVRFRNTSGHSLVRGVCTVFQEGAYVGKAILEETQRAEERTLPYALDSGVRVFPELLPRQEEAMHLRLNRGAAITEQTQTQQTCYRIQNSGGETFRFEIEHARTLAGKEVTVTLDNGDSAEAVEIPSGWRIGLALADRATVSVTVTERLLVSSQIDLTNVETLDWWLPTYLFANTALADRPGVSECLRCQTVLEQAKNALHEEEQQINEINDEQKRLMELLKVGGHEGAANEWRATLAENEKQVKEAKKTRLPSLRQAVRAAEEALQKAVAALALSWTA